MIVSYSDAIGRMRVLSVKTALSTLCAGRLVDKLRCKSLSYFMVASKINIFILPYNVSPMVMMMI